MLMITSTHHSKELCKKKKKRFCNPLTRNWHSGKISQETISEQKRGESEAECCLLDRLTQPRGRHLRHLFQIPIVFAPGDWAECSVPTASPELMFPPSWSLAQSHFWQFSPYDLNSWFCFHTRRALSRTQVIPIDPWDTLSQIPNPLNLRGSVYYYFSSLEFLSQSSDTRTNTERE